MSSSLCSNNVESVSGFIMPINERDFIDSFVSRKIMEVDKGKLFEKKRKIQENMLSNKILFGSLFSKQKHYKISQFQAYLLS